jgi:hypothetical protein
LHIIFTLLDSQQLNGYLAYGWKYTSDFYKACLEHNIQFGFSVNSLVEYDQLKKKVWNKPSRYFCCLTEHQYENLFIRPAGFYLIGTAFADYGCPDVLYKKIFSYIESHDIQICGNAYEEYLIDEIAEEDANHYLLQISIQISKNYSSNSDL